MALPRLHRVFGPFGGIGVEGVRVQGLGFRVQGLGFRVPVQGSGIRGWFLGLWGGGLRVQGLGAINYKGFRLCLEVLEV